MRKFWFEFRTISVKIRPHLTTAPDRMNEEIRQASDLARDPASVSWATYFWVVLLATVGGIVRVIREVKFGEKTWQQIIAIFVAEIIISVFAGVITFFLCAARDVPPFYSAVLVSLASYMGGRALSVLEALYKFKIGKGE